LIREPEYEVPFQALGRLPGFEFDNNHLLEIANQRGLGVSIRVATIG
jgi:hypothetical protein